ncbi:hypothetical protein D3C84_904410 [compost metagenome]
MVSKPTKFGETLLELLASFVVAGQLLAQLIGGCFVVAIHRFNILVANSLFGDPGIVYFTLKVLAGLFVGINHGGPPAVGAARQALAGSRKRG